MVDSEKWEETGLLTRVNVIPDHQLKNLESLSDESLRLFRISLVVLSVYGSAFGFIFNSGPDSVMNVFTQPTVAFSLFMFLVALGGFLIVYREVRSFCTNAIEATEYIELIEKFPSTSEEDLNDSELLYEQYWKRATDYNSSIRELQTMIVISSFSLYIAVIYAPLGLLTFYTTFHPLFFTAIVGGPMVVPLIFAKLTGLFDESGGIIVEPIDDTEQGSKKSSQ